MTAEKVKPDVRSMSTVVGVALLLAVTGIAMAVITPAVLGASMEAEGPLEVEDADLEFYYESSVADSEADSFGTTGTAIDADGIIVIRVDGTAGDLTADEVNVSVPESGGNLAQETAYTEGEALSTGDTVRVWVNMTDTVSVIWQSSETDQTEIIGEHRLPDGLLSTLDDSDLGGDSDDSDDFTIQDGGVVPDEEYTAEVELLGTGYTYGAFGPDIPIELDINVGGDSYQPWAGNINDGGNPRTTTFDDRDAGEKVTVTATADPSGTFISTRTRSSTDSSGYVEVLRDGDEPPNRGGFGDQDSAESYVQPYLDTNGRIDIADNEAIFLFELGNSQTGAAADYQDVVVLVTVTTE